MAAWPLQLGHHLLGGEIVGDLAERPVGVELLAVEGDDAGRLLAAMLQGVQAEDGARPRLLDARRDAEDAAFLLELVVVEGVGANHHACQMATDCLGSSGRGPCARWRYSPGSCFGAAAGFRGRLVVADALQHLSASACVLEPAAQASAAAAAPLSRAPGAGASAGYPAPLATSGRERASLMHPGWSASLGIAQVMRR